MSNLTYNQELFQPEIKENFLATISHKSVKTYKRMFIRSALSESLKGYDLLDFNLTELSDFLFSLKSSTVASARTNVQIVKNYIDWGIKHGHRNLNDNTNPLAHLAKDHHFLKSLVIEDQDAYVSLEELKDLTNIMVNAQDAVIPWLLFIGVKGEKCSEITNLLYSDIDWEQGILQLKDDKTGERELEIPAEIKSDVLQVLQQAIHQEIYLKNNGVFNSTRGTGEGKLIASRYVIRNVEYRKAAIDRVDEHTIYRRIKIIKASFGLNSLTAINMFKSGQIYTAKKLMERDGVLKKEQYLEIAERYNLPKFLNGNKLEYRWIDLKHYINAETIFERS